jgi:hypothetical protein
MGKERKGRRKNKRKLQISLMSKNSIPNENLAK